MYCSVCYPSGGNFHLLDVVFFGSRQNAAAAVSAAVAARPLIRRLPCVNQPASKAGCRRRGGGRPGGRGRRAWRSTGRVGAGPAAHLQPTHISSSLRPVALDTTATATPAVSEPYRVSSALTPSYTVARRTTDIEQGNSDFFDDFDSAPLACSAASFCRHVTAIHRRLRLQRVTEPRRHFGGIFNVIKQCESLKFLCGYLQIVYRLSTWAHTSLQVHVSLQRYTVETLVYLQHGGVTVVDRTTSLSCPYRHNWFRWMYGIAYRIISFSLKWFLCWETNKWMSIQLFICGDMSMSSMKYRRTF